VKPRPSERARTPGRPSGFPARPAVAVVAALAWVGASAAWLYGATSPNPSAPPPSLARAARPDGTPPAPADLAADARRMAEVFRRRFGPGYTVTVDRRNRLVYVSALDAATFAHVRATLSRYAAALQRLLFPEPLLWNVAVVLPTVRDYRAAGPPPGALGVYQPATRTLMSLSTSDVLVHEFVHALHHSDQVRAGQRHAAWVVEGLATLIQGSRPTAEGLEFLVGPDVVELQAAVRAGSLPPLADLLRAGMEAFRTEATRWYPYARYVMLMLARRGKLGEFYRTYKAGYTNDPSGRTALEQVLGAPTAQIEAAWRRWILALKPPWRPAHPIVAHLGIRMRPADEGVLVDGFLPGSAAARAGVLRVGDVILSVAGRATPTPADLGPAVRACRPGETVEIEILRQGRRTVVRHVLGAVRGQVPRDDQAAPSPHPPDRP